MTGTNLSVGTDVPSKSTARPSGRGVPIWQDLEEAFLTGCYQLHDCRQTKASRCHPRMAQRQASAASEEDSSRPQPAKWTFTQRTYTIERDLGTIFPAARPGSKDRPHAWCDCFSVCSKRRDMTTKPYFFKAEIIQSCFEFCITSF